jgi:hypothetical protein
MPGQELMLGLNASTHELASLPSHRRTWVFPELMSHSLLVLTYDQVHLAPQSGEPKAETLAAIEAGASLDDVFGSLAVVINLYKVRRLKLDLLNNSVVLEYLGAGSETSQQRIWFATPVAADACFTKIWRRLGNSFQLSTHTRDSWNLARAPLLLLLGTLLTTAVFVLLLNVFQDLDAVPEPDPTRLVKSGGLFASLDRRVVCAIGGVVAAVSQVWLYRRLTTPPVALEVTRNSR